MTISRQQKVAKMIDVFNQAMVDSFLAVGKDAVRWSKDVFVSPLEVCSGFPGTEEAVCLTRTGEGSLESTQEMKYGSTKYIYCQYTLTK